VCTPERLRWCRLNTEKLICKQEAGNHPPISLPYLTSLPPSLPPSLPSNLATSSATSWSSKPKKTAPTSAVSTSGEEEGRGEGGRGGCNDQKIRKSRRGNFVSVVSSQHSLHLSSRPPSLPLSLPPPQLPQRRVRARRVHAGHLLHLHHVQVRTRAGRHGGRAGGSEGGIGGWEERMMASKGGREGGREGGKKIEQILMFILPSIKQGFCGRAHLSARPEHRHHHTRTHAKAGA